MEVDCKTRLKNSHLFVHGAAKPCLRRPRELPAHLAGHHRDGWMEATAVPGIWPIAPGWRTTGPGDLRREAEENLSKKAWPMTVASPPIVCLHNFLRPEQRLAQLLAQMVLEPALIWQAQLLIAARSRTIFIIWLGGAEMNRVTGGRRLGGSIASACEWGREAETVSKTTTNRAHWRLLKCQFGPHHLGLRREAILFLSFQ